MENFIWYFIVKKSDGRPICYSWQVSFIIGIRFVFCQRFVFVLFLFDHHIWSMFLGQITSPYIQHQKQDPWVINSIFWSRPFRLINENNEYCFFSVKMAHYTLKLFLKSAKNYLIIIESMTHTKYVSQIGEKMYQYW